MSGLKLVNAIGRYVQHRLNDRTLGSEHHNFIVHIPETRTNTPRVAHGKTFSASRQSADYIASVPLGAGRFQYIGQVDAVLNGMGNVHPFQPFCLAFVEEPFHFAVEPVPHLFQHDIRIGILARMLACGGDVGEYLVHVRQVEVPAQGKVLRPPVVAAQERMHIRNAAPPRGGIAQMPHIQLARKGQAFLCIFRISKLFGSQVLKLAVHRTEYLGNRPRAQRPLAEHVFLSGVCLKLHASQPCAFLSAVVLLLHKQIELVQPIHPRPVLLLIIFQRLEQPYHRYPAFVFKWFHIVRFRLVLP